MASGRMPALTDLSLYGRGLSWGSPWPTEWESRLAPALEAVAGTLTRLTIENELLHTRSSDTENVDCVKTACHEVGVAIGKLRRLRYLSLSLYQDGRSYHAMARSVAASGGCPELFELRLEGVIENIESLTYEPSLIVPSVRRLRLKGKCSQESAQLLCCGLVRLGYRHGLDCDLSGRRETEFVHAAYMRPILSLGGISYVLKVPEVRDRARPVTDARAPLLGAAFEAARQSRRWKSRRKSGR
jgi:hypothetical protein